MCHKITLHTTTAHQIAPDSYSTSPFHLPYHLLSSHSLSSLAAPPVRLDMNTSGVLVAAKDRDTASLAHAQFRDKTVRKAYLALALGVPEQQVFTIDEPIGQHPDVKVARRVVEGGLPAITHVQVGDTGWAGRDVIQSGS